MDDLLCHFSVHLCCLAFVKDFSAYMIGRKALEILQGLKLNFKSTDVTARMHAFIHSFNQSFIPCNPTSYIFLIIF
jgi:hypothetical protein